MAEQKQPKVPPVIDPKTAGKIKIVVSGPANIVISDKRVVVERGSQ